jgi:hypothetical protein
MSNGQPSSSSNCAVGGAICVKDGATVRSASKAGPDIGIGSDVMVIISGRRLRRIRAMIRMA